MGARVLACCARLTPRRATQYYADKAEALDGGGNAVDVTLPDDRFTCRVVKEPLGVVGLITPWNYPCVVRHVRTAAPVLIRRPTGC